MQNSVGMKLLWYFTFSLEFFRISPSPLLALSAILTDYIDTIYTVDSVGSIVLMMSACQPLNRETEHTIAI